MSESEDTTPEFSLNPLPVSREEERKEKRRAYFRARYQANKEAECARQKAYYAANPQRMEARRLKYTYGITPVQFRAMIELQGNRCLCCQTQFGLLKGNRPRVDHCHATGRIRGILCHRCNILLGHAEDSADVLRMCAIYLEQTAQLQA